MNVKELLAKANPKFKDFLALRVGGMDEYNRLGYAALRNRMAAEDIAKTEAALEVHTERAKVYRWILRGLPCDYAIRKVKTDLQVAAHAQYAREEDDWWADDGNAEVGINSLGRGEISEGELREIIHGREQPEQTEVADYTLIRPHANKVIVTKDGEILAEKEINNDRHFENFVAKFRPDKAYRDAHTRRTKGQ